MCQINFHVGNLEKNYDLIFSAREKSKKENIDLCVFTELCMTGYPPEDLVLRPSLIDAVSIQIDKLIELTKDGGPAVIVGYPRNDKNILRNSASLIYKGEISTIDKYHLPNYGVFDEARVFNSGRISGPISFKGIRIGLMICEDMWHNDVTDTLVESGAQV